MDENGRQRGEYSASPTYKPALSPEMSTSGGERGEDGLTLRRREANRLAAQRFRSRKKGYQDSLEERIRILEEEKDIVARHGYLNYPRSTSPDKLPMDVDVRVSALEAANRRLQEEVRVVTEENVRLKDEVERWRKWERDVRPL